MLGSPAVREHLARRGRDAGSLGLWREHPFARLVESAVQRGVIDRLEARLEADGSAAEAIVFDFKTDEIDPGEARTAAEQYRPQLEAYRDAAAEFLSLDPEAVRMVVLFVHCDKAVAL